MVGLGVAACAPDQGVEADQEGGAGGAGVEGLGGAGEDASWWVEWPLAARPDTSGGPLSTQGVMRAGLTPSNDSCVGPTAFTLGSGQKDTRSGTLTDARDDAATFCADPSGGLVDVFYRVTLTSACSASFTLSGPLGFDGVLSLRTQSCSTDEYCSDAPAGVQERLVAPLAAGTYYLMVSGKGAMPGAFTLESDCAAPACGDGVKNASEACDDGNATNGDGCSASCTLEASAANVDTCLAVGLGAATSISPGQTKLLPASGVASTVGATDSGTGSCMMTPNYSTTFPARDHIYKVRPTANGSLKATLGEDGSGNAMCGQSAVEPVWPYPAGCYDRALHVRTLLCTDLLNEVACSDRADAWWAVETVTFAVSANVVYYVFVDGYVDEWYGSGRYVLKLEML